MENKYYKIIEKDNDKPYAYYVQKIKWIVKNIIDDNCLDGYIVQKVKLVNNTKIRGIDDKEYFEAWKVNNGIIENETSYDDCFMWYPSYLIEDCKENSKGKKGKIGYYCEVYWISKLNPLFNKVDLWGHEVPEALELKSIMANKIDFKIDKPLFIREFIHNVNY